MKISLLLVGLTLMASGCVSRRVYEADVSNAIKREKALCEANSSEKDDRLKRFNQLNPDGSLR